MHNQAVCNLTNNNFNCSVSRNDGKTRKKLLLRTNYNKFCTIC